MSKPYIFTASVAKIIDGDTIDVTDINLGFGIVFRGTDNGYMRIRLYGIDTEESRTRDVEEKKFGLSAKEFNKSFCPVGSKVILQTHEKGKYGRWLADIKVGNKWLCKELIKNNYAVEYYGQSKKDIKKAHLENRKKAIILDETPNCYLIKSSNETQKARIRPCR
jgi:micrococcal nuclease